MANSYPCHLHDALLFTRARVNTGALVGPGPLHSTLTHYTLIHSCAHTHVILIHSLTTHLTHLTLISSLTHSPTHSIHSLLAALNGQTTNTLRPSVASPPSSSSSAPSLPTTSGRLTFCWVSPRPRAPTATFSPTLRAPPPSSSTPWPTWARLSRRRRSVRSARTTPTLPRGP